MADDLATTLVKQRESYRSKPYWDVNHWRVGYGSDTTTDANGRVHKVTKDTVTTRADADRDLARRIPAFQQHAASVIGKDAWNALPEESKAGITSVAYNYGSLNKLHSLVRAAQTGDPQAISRAILNRADDNGGVNAQRRQAEAAVVLGHPVPLGTIPDQGVAAAGKVAKGTNFAVAGAPLPAPAPLTVKSLGSASGQSIGSRLPQDATFGIQDRLNPGQKAQLPTDFQTLFAHGAPVDARTMSLAAPARSLGAAGNVGNATTANGSATIVPGRSLGQPGAIKTTMAPAATVQMSASRPASVAAAPSKLQLLNNGNSPLDDIHDSRDAAVVAAQNATKPTFTVPKATYTPPANNNVGAAPVPQKQGLFQSLGGAIGSGMTALGNSANDAAKYLGKGVQDTVAAIPEKAQQAADYLTPLVLGNLEARSAFLDPMIARLGSPTAGDHSPTRYGATFQDRQQAAQDRERLSQGLPPQQRQSRPQPQPQQRQQAPVITTTFRNSSPAPKASPAPANNNGGGGGGNSGGGNGGGQTITGSATGRSYTVGATYSNKDGNFVAQSNGTFKKVS